MKNLSSLAGAPGLSGLTMNESESAGNTVTAQPPFAAPGSEPVNPLPDKNELDDPEARWSDDLGASGATTKKRNGHGTSYSPAPRTWKKAG